MHKACLFSGFVSVSVPSVEREWVSPSGYGLVVMYFCIGGSDLNIYFFDLRILHWDNNERERGEAGGRWEIRQVLQEGAGSQYQSQVQQVNSN